MRELHTPNPENVNVWAGIIGDHIIGPYFIDGNMNGETYLALLQNNVVPTMADLYPAEGNPQLPGNAIRFQQDGAPAHYEVNVLRGVGVNNKSDLEMISYGDRIRTQAEVVRLFQEKYPELPPISQGTVSKMLFKERGHVRQLKKNPPNKLSDDQKLDIMLMLE
ncbi:hypothetical protein NQ318_015322 [Aromia moschata]|uniref:Uncharacterized protein n=1 Tax=Aromia moschata TaxID=1265417 RepID=A0AAV8XX23_9CUCU|nr:hypothetical protein NQ318_015322 [Aromia moschata]